MSGVGASSLKQRHRDVVARKDLGGGLAGAVGEKAAVIADQDAALFLAPARNLIGERLRQAPDVVEREALADDRAPAAGAKGHLVLFLLAARPEEALLQNELGLLQVLARVDALDFIRVVDLVALDPQPRADELVHAIRQLILAVRAKAAASPARKRSPARRRCTRPH